MIERHGITLVGLTVTNLDRDVDDGQLQLPLDPVVAEPALRPCDTARPPASTRRTR